MQSEIGKDLGINVEGEPGIVIIGHRLGGDAGGIRCLG
jgi:hypothetical protein